MSGFRIPGWGTALPDKTVTNADLEGWLDTDDAWIRERTGIAERHVGDSTTALAVEAGRVALERSPGPVDLVLVATITPDQITPATASYVQAALGLEDCGAFDLNAACSGFVYGLVTARGLLATGLRRILLVGAETLSRITDWDDRRTAIIFADGAAAVVLEATDGPENLLGHDLGSDGGAADILRADLGGYLRMDGREVFTRAVAAMVDSCRVALRRAGLTAADVDLVVPHQANARIIEAGLDGLGIARERASMVIERVGNTSAASVPLALADALEHDRLHDGDVVLFVGFGAGMAWASAVVRWQG
ncbi:MAG: ketoacyl-ACP synthase III [Acidimicrobiales bacterium]|nr:ketoacyl-ACP synthase III [Acidimicrobiales bacterium]MCB1016326.1 ketoacyl-ACP synthase III [Acidimicrobiales bacterium]